MYIDSLFGFVGLIALVGLVVVVARQNGRICLLEREIGALRSMVLSQAMPAAAPRPVAEGQAVDSAVAPMAERAETVDGAAAPALALDEALNAIVEEAAPAGPWSAAAAPAPAGERASWSGDAADQMPPQAAGAARKEKPDIETALGTRWAVWVGGLALALGGLFLVRYTIESGFFGPAARLSIAAVFGLALVGAGEFIRRTGYRLPVEGAVGAYIPAVLTAAGVFTLFGTIYAAHGRLRFHRPGARLRPARRHRPRHAASRADPRSGAGRRRPPRRHGDAGAGVRRRRPTTGCCSSISPSCFARRSLCRASARGVCWRPPPTS